MNAKDYYNAVSHAAKTEERTGKRKIVKMDETNPSRIRTMKGALSSSFTTQYSSTDEEIFRMTRNAFFTMEIVQ